MILAGSNGFSASSSLSLSLLSRAAICSDAFASLFAAVTQIAEVVVGTRCDWRRRARWSALSNARVEIDG